MRSLLRKGMSAASPNHEAHVQPPLKKPQMPARQPIAAERRYHTPIHIQMLQNLVLHPMHLKGLLDGGVVKPRLWSSPWVTYSASSASRHDPRRAASLAANSH